jgi:hypothetical protein
MEKKIADKLYKMWLFREEASKLKGTIVYSLRDARLNGAVELIKAMGYEVEFNPLAENQNPFTVKEQ